MLDFTTKNDVYGIYKYTGNENYYFKINVNKAGNKCNINYKDVKNINSSLYNDISSNIIQGSNSNTFSILGNNGIFGKFTLSSEVNSQKKSSDVFGDVFLML